MGLSFPEDLAAWQRWQHQPSQSGWLRWISRQVHGIRPQPTRSVLHMLGEPEQIRTLVVLDGTNVTSRMALLPPIAHCHLDQVAVLAPASVSQWLPAPELGHTWSERPGLLSDHLHSLTGVADVLSIGHFLEVGRAVHAWADAREIASFVVQHGLITPMAPPLPSGCTWLAWSAADASFGSADRADIDQQVVGSQLLWEAASQQVPAQAEARPVFLGQLHGAELPRAQLRSVSHQFCSEYGATYRPHPSEIDRRSRATHRAWQQEGIEVDSSAASSPGSGRPIVSVFSTGVLEAAARGIPSWVYHPVAPPWLSEFWSRYGMSPWGGPPTEAAEMVPTSEPGLATSSYLAASHGGRLSRP